MTRADDVSTRRRWGRVFLLVIVPVMVAVFWAVQRAGNDDEGGAGAGAPAQSDGAPAFDSATTSPVDDYFRFTGVAGDTPAPEPDAIPAYVAEGLRKLAGALGALMIGSPDLQIDLRVAAEHLLLNPASTATTTIVRRGLIAAAEAIPPSQGSHQVDLRRIAQSIDSDRPLIDQEAAVRNFFRESAMAMQRLANPA